MNDAPAPERIATWEALLAGWTEFARASVALPDSREGERWREAVAPIISVSAITHAINDISRLPAPERGVGLDTARVQLRTNITELHALWSGEPLPGEVALLIDEARDAMQQAESAGIMWCVGTDKLQIAHPGDAQTMIAGLGFDGDVYVPTPGVPLFAGSPCAFVSPGSDDDILEQVVGVVHALLATGDGEATEPQESPAMQVYRQFDFGKGGPVRDVVRPMVADPIAGQPLLVPAMLAGEVRAVTLPVPGADRVDPLPVEFDQED